MEPAVSAGPRLTPEAKEAIERAVHRARASGPRSIATEDLLLSVLGLDHGAAADLLRSRGVDLVALQARTAQLASLPSGARGGRRAMRLHALDRPEWEVPGGASRNNVVMCRLDDAQIEAIDILIEAGARANRGDAAAWLIKVGLDSKAPVVDAVREKVAEIRRIRADARTLAENADAAS